MCWLLIITTDSATHPLPIMQSLPLIICWTSTDQTRLTITADSATHPLPIMHSLPLVICRTSRDQTRLTIPAHTATHPLPITQSLPLIICWSLFATGRRCWTTIGDINVVVFLPTTTTTTPLVFVQPPITRRRGPVSASLTCTVWTKMMTDNQHVVHFCCTNCTTQWRASRPARLRQLTRLLYAKNCHLSLFVYIEWLTSNQQNKT